MHELALAESVVRVVCAHAAGRPVTRVELKIGHLRQVVPSALEFSFRLVAQGTEAEGAELVMEQISAAGRCSDCGAESELHGFPLRCGACGGLGLELLRGEELLVDSLEVEDVVMTNGGSRHDG